MSKKLGLAGLAAVLLVGPLVFWRVKCATVKVPLQAPARERLKPEAELTAALDRANDLEKQGKRDRAIPLLERALVLTPQVYGSNSLETYHARIAVALRYQAVGRYREAATLNHRSLSDFGNADEALQYKYARWRFLRQRLADWTRQPPPGIDPGKLPEQLQAMRQEADQLDRDLKRIGNFDRLLGLAQAEETIGDRTLAR